jgi:hypothetical protein
MNCGRAQELLIDLLYEELDADGRATVVAHLETCADCRLHWTRIRTVAAAADRWSAPPVSRGIAERALVRVVAEQRAARPTPVAPAALIGRALLAGGAALVSLLLVAGITGRPDTPVGMAVLAIVWTVFYAGVFLASWHPAIRAIARAAVTGAGVALVLLSVMTIPSVVEACVRWVGAAQRSGPLALVLAIVAAGYTAAPLLAGGLGARAAQGGGWLVDGLKLSGLYVLLIAPAVYLECVALPAEVTALWMAGALLGAAAAGPIGLRMGDWLRQATVK